MTYEFKSFDAAKELCETDSAQLLTKLDVDTVRSVGNFYFDRIDKALGDREYVYWLAIKKEGIDQSFYKCSIKVNIYL